MGLLSRGTNGSTAYTQPPMKVQGRDISTLRISAGFQLSHRVGLIELWLVSLVSVALVLATSLAAQGWGLGNTWAVAGLAAVAVLAERNRVRLSDHIEVSICLLPTLLAGVLFGPLAAMLVWGISMAGGFSREGPSPYLRLGIYSSSRSIAGAVTGFVAFEIAHGPIDDTFIASMAAAGVGAIVAQTLDVLFASCTLRLRRSGAALDVMRTLAPLVLAAVPLYMPIVAVLTLAYTQISAWTLVVFFVPALAAQRLFAMYQHQRRLAEDLAVVNDRLERANLSFATALVATLDARDRVHGWSLGRCRHLRARHRGAARARRGRAAAGTRVRPRSRRRQDRAAAWAPREAGGTDTGRTSHDGDALRDRRAHPCEGRGLRRDRSHRAPPPRTVGRTGISGRLGR